MGFSACRVLLHSKLDLEFTGENYGELWQYSRSSVLGKCTTAPLV